MFSRHSPSHVWRDAALAGITLAFPQIAEACQGCADHELSAAAPGLLAVFPIFWGWMAMMCWQRRRTIQKHPDLRPEEIPGNQAYRVWMILGILNAITIVFLFPHSAALSLALGWIIYLIMSLSRSLISALVQRTRNSVGIPTTRINLIALVVICVMIPAATAWGQRPTGVISRINLQSASGMLDHRIPSQLLACGPDIVSSLVQTLYDPNLAAANCYAGRSRAAYCLSRFGGPAAETALGSLVDEIDSKSTFNFRWERVAASCYANLLGPRGTETLIRKYHSLDPQNSTVGEQRVFLLSALARTRSRKGIQFVFENAKVLEDALKEWHDLSSERIAIVTLQTLLDSDDPRSFSNIPLETLGRRSPKTSGMTQTGLDDRDLSKEAPEPQPLPQPEKILERWQRDRKKSRLKWEQLLPEAVDGAQAH